MDDNRHDRTQSPFNASRTRARRARDVFALTLLGTVAAGVSCTFINSFEDLKAHDADAGGNDSNLPGDSGGVDSNVPPGDTGTDTPDTFEPVNPLTHGLIVEGAEVPTDAGSVQQVLAVINPTTGEEYPGVREDMTVVNVMYDGGRDVWFIFENTTASDRVQPAPGDAVTLHVRAWDYDNAKWKETAGKKDVATITGLPTPFTRDAMAVLSEEIAYVAFTGTGSTGGLVLVRTSDLAKPVQIGTTTALAGPLPIGVVGTRKSGSKGGNIAIFRYGTCTTTGVGCPIELLHYTAPATFAEPVPPTGAAVVVATIDTKDGNPSFGTGTDGINSILIGTPFATTADPRGAVQFLNPDTLGADKTAIHFGMPESTKFLRAMAVDECDEGVLFIPELLSQKVHVVPLAKPDAAIVEPLGNPGQRVTWEPYTRSMLAPVKQGVTSDVPAWKVTIDATTKIPKLTKRGSDWKYPGNELRPNVVTPKAPTSSGFDCSK